MRTPLISKRKARAAVLSLFIFLVTGCAARSRQDSLLRLRSDNADSISRVVVSTNSARRALLRNAELTSNIVNALPERIKIYILVNDKDAFVVGHNPWPDRIKFLEIDFEKSITMWPQDPFLVLEDGKRTVLLASKTFDRASDELMAQKIATALGYKLKKSDLMFEGGNIVSDDSAVFIGANTIRHNAHYYQMSDTEIALAFEDELGKKVIVVGPFPQPIAHIDMMVTPIGEQQLVVADSGAGAEIVEGLLEANPSVIEEFEEHCEEYFYGHPAITEVVGKDGEMLRRPELSGLAHKMVEKSKALAPLLNKIASGLESHGYKIYRIPFLYGGPTAPGDEDLLNDLVPSFPMLTYNNVLQEHGDQAQRVYVPAYGLSALDSAAMRTWSDLGFEAKIVRGFEISAMYGGALRCAAKILQ